MDYIQKKLEENGGHIVNFYRPKRIKDKVLLTTDHGTWVSLSVEAYDNFLAGKIDSQLYPDLINRGIIITVDNYEQIIEGYYKRYKHIQTGAALHIIVPTIRCNLRCVYCHSEAAAITEGNQYDMDERTLLRTLEFIFQSPKKKILIEFQGGEPLLNKPMVKLTFEYAEKLSQQYNKEYKLALVTNLLAMDEEFLDYLAARKDKFMLTSSLDGPKEVHDKNRLYVHSNSGTYDQVTKWVRRCNERGIHVGLLMVTTRYSLPYWKEIVDEYVKWGQRTLQVKPLDYLGYAVDVWDEIGYTMEEFVEFWTKSVNYMFELLDEGTVIVDRYLHLILKNILHGTDTGFLDLGSPCGMIRGQIVYNYNGDIYCCDEARVMEDFIVGNVFRDNYLDLIRREQSKNLIKRSILEGYYCDSCAYKPFCGICPVLHYGQEGDYRIKLNKTNRCARNRTVLDYAFNKLIFEREKIQRLVLGLMLKNRIGNSELSE